MNTYLLLKVFVVFGLTLWSVGAQRSRTRDYNKEGKSWKRRSKSDRPNIVFILTDDQDELLGSMEVMPKTLRIMRDQGVHFNNSFVSSPMCCPSRSTILTGMYTHNHNTYTNNENCSSLYWQRNHETRSFATYLNDAGYRTGYFGKYLNEYNGTYIPPGWREWVGLIRNTRFYNYTVNFNGNKMKHQDNYYLDYFTDLIANDSVTFLKQSKQYFPKRPVLMVLSVPAPHGPEDSAPQYQHLFYNNTLHRTPSWNVAPNYDKQYLLKVTDKMEPIEQKFTDVLQQKRLQTLQSVDDLVEKVYNELWNLGELENTYIIYTSDHGYHLGQFGVIKGKALPYDFDVRVPLYIRGPGVKPRSKISNVVVNADLAPTILDMAGVPIPEHMDGRSMLKLIKSYREPENVDARGFVKTRRPWRDTILLERGKISTKKLKELMREQKKNFLENLINMPSIPEDLLQYATPKQRRIYKQCSKLENQPPCKEGQKYKCVQEPGRKLPRLMKCRSNEVYGDENMQKDNSFVPRRKRKCVCRNSKDGIDEDEKRIQMEFLKKHVRSDFQPTFIRTKRSYLKTFGNIDTSDLSNIHDIPGLQPFDRRCRVLPNSTVSCDKILYQDPNEWKTHKEKLDEMIQEYRKMLEDLRTYRKHLKDSKPKNSFLQEYGGSSLGPGYLDSFSNSDGDLCDCEEDVKKLERRKEIEDRRRRRRERKKKKNKNRKRRRNKDCSKPGVKCNGDDRNLQAPPLWNSSYWNLPPYEKVKRRKHPACKRSLMDCALMDNTHWKTPPYWTNGPFCFCTNSNNNTYWCIRTVNQTHDLLYCEFINNFISYYDMTTDPFQLRNAIHDVNYGILQQLHEQLNQLRACSGSKSCNKAGIWNKEDKAGYLRYSDADDLVDENVDVNRGQYPSSDLRDRGK